MRSLLVALAGLTFSLSCAPGVTVPETTHQPVASIVITGAGSALLVGQTMQLGVVVKDAANTVVTDRPVTWATSAANMATVTSTGLVTATGPGTPAITATSEGVTAQTSLTVTTPPPPPPAPVAVVTVTGSTTTLAVAQTTQLTATTRDASNNVLAGRAVSWASTNLAAATVTGAGLVTAVAAGTATIRATSEGVVGSYAMTITAVPPPPPPPPVPVASVTVTGSTTTLVAGQTTQLTATTRDANNAVLTGRVVTWASTNPAAATVTGAGLVTALAAGGATIRATSEAVVGSYAMTFTAAPPPPPNDLAGCSATASINAAI